MYCYCLCFKLLKNGKIIAYLGGGEGGKKRGVEITECEHVREQLEDKRDADN